MGSQRDRHDWAELNCRLSLILHTFFVSDNFYYELIYGIRWRARTGDAFSPESICICLFCAPGGDVCCAKSLGGVRLCDPTDCSLPGSSVHGVLQARILEWVAISISRESSWPRDRIRISCISCIGRQILYHWATLLDLNTWGICKSSYTNLPSCWTYWNWLSGWFKVSHPLSWPILYNET